ncbi:acid protease [Ramaria rubella]|nr:acid protease [Ramaria rubella]
MSLSRSLILIIFGMTTWTVTVNASPVVEIRDSVISVPLAVQLNATGGAHALLRVDRARFAALRTQGTPPLERKSVPASVLDTGVRMPSVIYTCQVGVGSPPTQYTLLVDTGSSNTWVGAEKKYKATKSSHKTSNNVSVSYGSGQFSGIEYTDTVSIASTTIKAQSIGVASNVSGLNSGLDGILGIGPVDLTLGTLHPATLEAIPTVTENLKTQQFISAAKVGISFEPTTSTSESNGQLDFGGTDSSKYTGSIHYVPVTDIFPAATYWGITQSVTYGSSTPILSALPPSAGIVDTGTTLIYLPTPAFQRYQSASGGIPDPITGLLSIPQAKFKSLKSLLFTIDGVKYEFTANAQIWPRHLNSFIGGNSESVYLIVADIGSTSDNGVKFVNGFVWLQRFYAVFDTDNRRIGFANTPFTHAKSN